VSTGTSLAAVAKASRGPNSTGPRRGLPGAVGAQPVHQPHAVHAGGVLSVVVGPGDKPVERHRHGQEDSIHVRNVASEPLSADDDVTFWTSWVTDPDGYRIELVQWPAGYPDGMTRSDLIGPPS